MNKIGLVLEGGGLRGLYTSGVLDLFLEKNINLNYCIGVSAGACNALSYFSKQHKLNYKMTTKYVKDKKYLSFNNLFRTGSIFNMEMMFDTIPNKLENFDQTTFRNYAKNFVVVTTDCETGKAEYYKVCDFERDRDIVKASSSLPLLSNIVKYDGRNLLDGGLADPIPIKKSVEDGNKKHIIVLTQSMGFREKPAMFMGLMEFKYKDYPKLLETIKIRHHIYNTTLDYIEKLEKNGQAIVLRPSHNMQISAIEKDLKKLKVLYDVGHRDAHKIYEKIRKFIEDGDKHY